MARDEKIETEGFRNQTMTKGAAERQAQTPARPKKKVVALQLDERQQFALKHIGGVEGLKRLLCPDEVCLVCRKEPPSGGTRFDSLCTACEKARMD